MLGIVGRWIDGQRNLKTGLLALRPLEGHRGSDMTAVLLPVLKTFNIQDKLGAFQMDNATSNDAALEALEAALPATIDVKQSRLRCFGHIINLVVKALLYRSGSASLQKQLDDVGDDDAFKIWREQGAIGHLHDIVTYVRGPTIAGVRSRPLRRSMQAISRCSSSRIWVSDGIALTQ